MPSQPSVVMKSPALRKSTFMKSAMEGLVAKGEAQKGRVSPPTVPIVLNPEGAFSVGISVGNRHADVVLIDFVGAVRFHATLPNPEAKAGSDHSEFLETIRLAVSMLPKKARERLAGVGLALPHGPSNGRDSEAYFRALQDEIEEQLGISVFVQTISRPLPAGRACSASSSR